MSNTITVALKRNWWNQQASMLYKRDPGGVEIPAVYEKILPSSAVVLSETEVKQVHRNAKKKADEEKPMDTLSALGNAMAADTRT